MEGKDDKKADAADGKHRAEHQEEHEGTSSLSDGKQQMEHQDEGSSSRQKMLRMSVIERTEYVINKAKSHLTAGANRIYGGAKVYSSVRPQEIAALNHIGARSIISGQDHMIAIDLSGRLWSWGRGESGQLGLETFNHSGVPKIIEHLNLDNADARSKTKLKQVVCGKEYSAALLDSGQLYTWGKGKDGQLGQGKLESINIPKALESMHRRHVQQIACGASHMLALTTAREVFTWGSNQYGQLGHGEARMPCLVPKQVRVMNP